MDRPRYRRDHRRSGARPGFRGRLHPRHRVRRRESRPEQRACRDALPAGAERLPPHRPRKIHLPEFRHRVRVRRHVQPEIRRHQPDERERRVRGIDQGGRAVARIRVGRGAAVRLGLFPAALRVRGPPDPARPRLRGQRELRRDSTASRDADRAGHRQPVPEPVRRREPRSVRPHAGRRVRGWRTRAPRADRHGVAEHQHARPDPLSHPARASLPDGRRLVDLPDVRLRAPAVRRHRADHALALHARVRGSPAALRLAHRAPAGAGPAAADRVRPAQSHLHGDEQAQAARPRAGGARQRVGRSADADDCRDAPARLHAGGDPHVLRAHRRRQAREHRRRRAARARRPRGSQPDGAARHGRPRSAPRRHRELSGGAVRDVRGRQQSGGSVGRDARRAVLARALHRARRFPRGSAEEVLPARARARSAAARRVLRHLHAGDQGCRRRDRGTSLHVRSRHARRGRARRAEGEGDAPLGLGRARARRGGQALRSAVHDRNAGRFR